MFLLWITVAAMLWQAPATPPAESISIRENEIWLQTESGRRQLTHDGIPKRLPKLSPSGDTVIYVVDHPIPQNAPEETIDLLDLQGNIKQRVIQEGYVPSAFDRLEWIDEHRIGAMSCGHANCMYWVLSPESGKTIEVLFGGFDFLWSHNRQFVARRSMAYSCDGAMQGDLCPQHDALMFNIDGVFPYPLGTGKDNGDDRESHSLGLGIEPQLVWSPDDKWVAFTDFVDPEGDWYVVLVSPGGQVLRDTVPIGPGDQGSLEWADETHLALHVGERTFHFALKGAQFSEIRTYHCVDCEHIDNKKLDGIISH